MRIISARKDDIVSVNRSKKISDIQEMLGIMSEEQLENVFVYTEDELKEPNHEAVALNAIIQLSRKYGDNHIICRNTVG